MAEASTTATVTEADLVDLLPLMRAYCDFYKTSPSDADLLATAKQLIADPEGAGLQVIARNDSGSAIGFATLVWGFDITEGGRVAVMHDLYVEGNARGRGVGEQLIEECRTRAAQAGGRALSWQTEPSNERAQSLYNRIASGPKQWLEFSIDL